MPSASSNIFTDIPEHIPEELFASILKRDNVYIERIVSKGHITPAGQWYDQAWDEWVILLHGKATIVYEQDQQIVQLTAGDYLLLPAHTRHRIEWTSPETNTVWLAVHLKA
ncbi:MAG: cupin domain-containing protein [Methylococcales bacterium]|nr:cupin domain-containing protein [Methylococcales bacterium]